MTTTLSTEDIAKNLSNLVELDFDAIAAYKAAIERLENPTYKAKLTEFLGDHERHIRELSDVVRTAGGTPPDSGDAKKILTKGKVVIADMGGDKAILKAMKSNEDQTNAKYEKAVDENYPLEAQTVLQGGLADERRHRAWIELTLTELS